MDQVPLVTEQIEDGRRLIERLVRDSFPVLAACWLKESDRSQCELYLVSPVVEDEGIHEAYLRLHPIIREMQGTALRFDPFDVTLLGPSETIAGAILDVQRRFAGRLPVQFGERSFGLRSFDGGYIYSPLVPAAGSVGDR